MKKLIAATGVLLLTGCSMLPTQAPSATVEAITGEQLLSMSKDRVTLNYKGSGSASRSGKGWSIPDAAKIKSDSDSFKLKNSAGTTQWKVKFSDKVKILQGEETVLCEITTPEPNRFKTKRPEGTELGTARADDGGTRLQEGSDTNIARSKQKPSAAMAAMFCTDVPADARAVIIGELAQRGR